MVFEDVSGDLPPLPFRLLQLLAGPHQNFHYVIGDPAGHRAAVIDPAFELEALFQAAEARHLQIDRALFTHGHWDHIGGLPEVLAYGVEEVVAHEALRGHPKVQEAAEDGAKMRFVSDGDVLYVGGVPVQALHTPGHQPESTCFLAGEQGATQALFGGDCLFVGSCGRTDFPGGDTDAMFQSLQRIRDLAGDVWLFPGHHYAYAPCAPLSQQTSENPALATADRDAFEALPFLRG